VSAVPDVRRPPGIERLGLPEIRLLRRDPLKLLERVKSYGDVAWVRVGPVDLYLLSHPDHVKDVLVTNHRRFTKGMWLNEAKALLGEGLVTSDGEFHRRQRRLVQPAFHHQRLPGYAARMVDYAERSAGRWAGGEELAMDEAMNELTLAIVAKTLFDTDVEHRDAEQVRESLTLALELYNLSTNWLEANPQEDRMQQDRYRNAVDALNNLVYGMIEERRRSGVDRGDLLSMLVLARDEEEGGRTMTDVQIRDEAMTLVLAGHETTANALTWTWYLLSQNPEAEAQFHAELDQVLGGRAPTMDDLPALRYTRMVMAEAMRLYPPVPRLGRRAAEDHEVGGYVIPAGSLVSVSQYLIQRDERWWPDPERFDPDRWRTDAAAERPKFSYFPFGGGVRLCIGEEFAWMEGILILATVGRRWRFRLVPDHPVEPFMTITLRPKHGMQMVAESRS
jgi:cytochrome P450